MLLVITRKTRPTSDQGEYIKTKSILLTLTSHESIMFSFITNVIILEFLINDLTPNINEKLEDHYVHR